MNQKKCEDCAHYNDNCKYKACLAKLADIHIDCKDCPVVRCIMGVTDNNVGKKSDVKIEDMDLSVRTYNCLKRAGLFTLSQLSKLSYEDFTHIRNLGKRQVNEIIDKLKCYGYEILRGDIE